MRKGAFGAEFSETIHLEVNVIVRSKYQSYW
jgi:hypothetical protein